METLAKIAAYTLSEPFALGAWMTLKVSVVSLALGLVLGLLLAIAGDSRHKPLRAFSVFYLWLFRGTPVLFQLVFVFNVLPQAGIVLSGFVCAVVALSLNEAANMSEIMRSGLQAIGPNQRVAGRALALTELQILRRIVLPQALRVVIPPIGNQFINMLKMSALVSVIAVQDLMLVANQAASASFKYLEALSAAGIYYLAITSVFMLLQGRIEWWANPKNRRRAAAPA
jgi:polar amino acid transport system permease protein